MSTWPIRAVSVCINQTSRALLGSVSEELHHPLTQAAVVRAVGISSISTEDYAQWSHWSPGHLKEILVAFNLGLFPQKVIAVWAKTPTNNNKKNYKWNFIEWKCICFGKLEKLYQIRFHFIFMLTHDILEPHNMI